MRSRASQACEGEEASAHGRLDKAKVGEDKETQLPDLLARVVLGHVTVPEVHHCHLGAIPGDRGGTAQ